MYMFKTMQWSTFHFVMIPLSMLFMPLLILVVHQDYSQYSDYIAPFSWIFFPLLWFFLIKRGLSLRRSERTEQVAFLNNSGFYEISMIDAMKRSELYLRCKLQFKYPNQDFSSLTMFQLRLKSFAEMAGDVGTAVGTAKGTAKGLSDSFKEGWEKVEKEHPREADDRPKVRGFMAGFTGTNKKVICQNCGSRLQKGMIFGGWSPIFDSHCTKQGKKCVPQESLL